MTESIQPLEPPAQSSGGTLPEDQAGPTPWPESLPHRYTRRPYLAQVLAPILIFLTGLGVGYLLGVSRPAPLAADSALLTPVAPPPSATISPAVDLLNQINPPQGYTLPVSFGDLGPRLVAAGAIDADRFVRVYQEAGQPLTGAQQAALAQGSQAPIVVNGENAYFLLNFFWAVGLVNQNPVLTEGPMMSRGQDQVGNFASTGGWTLGAKPATELYASLPLIPLTPAQQARLVEVASAVYRPCCDNSTLFPDCNHGMAMLGLLELMASHDATTDEMFTAAKYVNAFWFPQQTFELATLFEAEKQLSFDQVAARDVVGKSYMSASGFRAAHEQLSARGLLQTAPSQGGGCAVN